METENQWNNSIPEVHMENDYKEAIHAQMHFRQLDTTTTAICIDSKGTYYDCQDHVDGLRRLFDPRKTYHKYLNTYTIMR